MKNFFFRGYKNARNSVLPIEGLEFLRSEHYKKILLKRGEQNAQNSVLPIEGE